MRKLCHEKFQLVISWHGNLIHKVVHNVCWTPIWGHKTPFIGLCFAPSPRLERHPQLFVELENNREIFFWWAYSLLDRLKMSKFCERGAVHLPSCYTQNPCDWNSTGKKKISSNRVIFVEEVLVSLAGPSEYLPCVCVCCAYMHAKVASFVSNSCDSMTVACQAPLSLGFSQKESWGELPYPPSGVFPIQGSNPWFLRLLQWQGGSLPLHLGSPVFTLWNSWC